MGLPINTNFTKYMTTFTSIINLEPGLENSMDCIVHGVTKNPKGLTDFHFSLSQTFPSPLLTDLRNPFSQHIHFFSPGNWDLPPWAPDSCYSPSWSCIFLPAPPTPIWGGSIPPTCPASYSTWISPSPLFSSHPGFKPCPLFLSKLQKTYAKSIYNM